jgi:hypothetical protein
MDDRVDRCGRVQQLMAGGLELAGDRGAQKAPGTGDVHPAEARFVHLDRRYARRHNVGIRSQGDLDGRSMH